MQLDVEAIAAAFESTAIPYPVWLRQFVHVESIPIKFAWTRAAPPVFALVMSLNRQFRTRTSLLMLPLERALKEEQSTQSPPVRIAAQTGRLKLLDGGSVKVTGGVFESDNEAVGTGVPDGVRELVLVGDCDRVGFGLFVLIDDLAGEMLHDSLRTGVCGGVRLRVCCGVNSGVASGLSDAG
jgi:hypothetical protein